MTPLRVSLIYGMEYGLEWNGGMERWNGKTLLIYASVIHVTT